MKLPFQWRTIKTKKNRFRFKKTSFDFAISLFLTFLCQRFCKSSGPLAPNNHKNVKKKILIFSAYHTNWYSSNMQFFNRPDCACSVPKSECFEIYICSYHNYFKYRIYDTYWQTHLEFTSEISRKKIEAIRTCTCLLVRLFRVEGSVLYPLRTKNISVTTRKIIRKNY